MFWGEPKPEPPLALSNDWFPDTAFPISWPCVRSFSVGVPEPPPLGELMLSSHPEIPAMSSITKLQLRTDRPLSLNAFKLMLAQDALEVGTRTAGFARHIFRSTSRACRNKSIHRLF